MDVLQIVEDSQRMLGADKMWHHLERLGQWQSGYLPAPVTVELDVSNVCNHRCPGCTFSYLVNKSKAMLPFDLARKTIDELAGMGVKAVTFSGGGEPLTYGEERLLKLMRRVRYAGLDCALITNGSMLSSLEYPRLCEWLRVSLDAYDQETFQKFHGRDGAEFHRVVANINMLGDESRHWRALGDRTGTLGVGFLTDKDSLDNHDIDKMSNFASRLRGVDYVQFRPLVANRVVDNTLGGGWDEFGPADVERLMGQISEASSKYGRDDFEVLASVGKYWALASPDLQKTYPSCWAHFLQCAISADGGVYVCCHMQGDDAGKLGDLREADFPSIWRGAFARQVVSAIDPRRHCPPACRLHQQNLRLHKIALRDATHVNFI